MRRGSTQGERNPATDGAGRRRMRRGAWAGALVGALLVVGTGWAEETARPASAGGGAPTFRRARHIEFDERLIMGQSLKAGALYLFERKDSEIQSMIKVREDYREELLAPLEPAP